MYKAGGIMIIEDIKSKKQLSKAKKLLAKAMEHLNYEDNHSELNTLRQELLDADLKLIKI